MSLTLLFLMGCSQQAVKTISPTDLAIPPLEHAYDFQLINSQNQNRITVKQLAQQLTGVDVVFIGEFHSNHASHLLEMQLFSALHHLKPNKQMQMLSMEMFNRDQQPILNRYLDSEIGEVYLIEQTPTWNNYVGAYRPLVEYAKHHFIPIIAANASADIVRCIGRQGKPYLDKLLTEERPLIASKPFTDNAEYRQRYMDFLEDVRKLTPERKERSYLAQLTRDNTMAESINQAWLENPGTQIVHINGSFHSENHLGTVTALQKLNPKLKIAVISPVRIENPDKPSYSKADLKKGDVIYLLQGQPEQYQDAVYKRQDRKNLFNQAQQKLCR